MDWTQRVIVVTKKWTKFFLNICHTMTLLAHYTFEIPFKGHVIKVVIDIERDWTVVIRLVWTDYEAEQRLAMFKEYPAFQNLSQVMDTVRECLSRMESKDCCFRWDRAQTLSKSLKQNITRDTFIDLMAMRLYEILPRRHSTSTMIR